MTGRDWYSWHDSYDRPGSGLSQRLAWVQDRIRAALDDAPPGPVRAISLCAGQGRVARRLAAEADLAGVEIVTGDAALTSQYADLVPRICEWFEERGFERVWLSDPGYLPCCGAHRFTGTPAPLETDAVMFTFTDHDAPRGPRRTAGGTNSTGLPAAIDPGDQFTERAPDTTVRRAPADAGKRLFRQFAALSRET